MRPRRRTTLADLRPGPSGRWTARLKADAVFAVERGDLTAGAVIEGLGLSPDEFTSWRRRLLRHGQPAALRETRLQEYR